MGNKKEQGEQGVTTGKRRKGVTRGKKGNKG